MTTSPRGWLAALLIPAVIVSGLTGAIVANAESVSRVRVAQADYDEAWDYAVAVHERADAARRDAAALALRADQLLYTATTYQGLAHLDPESLAALAPLVESLDLALAMPLPADVALPARLRSESPAELAAESGTLREWADALASDWAEVPPHGVSGTMQALEWGLTDVAQGVATVGASLLASKGGASAETRAALTDAINAVAEAVAEDAPTFAAVTAYVVAAQAVVDSQTAADAAAAAAAAAQGNESSGSGGSQPEVTVPYHWWLYTLKPEQTCAEMMVIAGVRPGETAECWYVGGPEPVPVP